MFSCCHQLRWTDGRTRGRAEEPGGPRALLGSREDLTRRSRFISLVTTDILTEEQEHKTPGHSSCRLLPGLRSRTRFCSIFKAGCSVVTAIFKLHLVRSRILERAVSATDTHLHANIRLPALPQLITTNPEWVHQYFTSLKNKAMVYYYSPFPAQTCFSVTENILQVKK